MTGSVPLLTALILFSCLVAHGQDVPGCSGTVGGVHYDLASLAQATGGQEVTAKNSLNQVFYYRPCNFISRSQCATSADPKPAVCQQDEQTPPIYYDCGSLTSASFAPLPNAQSTDGFLLTFQGGSRYRNSAISFICDPSAGVGQLEFKSENPVLAYHFEWRTKYACSTAPPPKEAVCCLYERGTSDFKTLCAAECPPRVGDFRFTANWTVPGCSQSNCFFNKKR